MTPGRDSTASRSARIRRVPTSEQVSQHIRRLIFDGVLRPGDRIPQDAIAADLGVSRIPVREALIEMARDGLVVNEPHIGAFVGDFDEQVVRDHFDIVSSLQGMAAERLAAIGDPQVFAQLRELAKLVERSSDPDEIHRATVEFQRVINHGGGSARIRAVLRALGRMFPSGVFDRLPRSAEVQKKAVAETWAALERRDAPAIRASIDAANRTRADVIIDELRARGTIS